jgi:hypothetical protein
MFYPYLVENDDQINAMLASFTRARDVVLSVKDSWFTGISHRWRYHLIINFSQTFFLFFLEYSVNTKKKQGRDKQLIKSV